MRGQVAAGGRLHKLRTPRCWACRGACICPCCMLLACCWVPAPCTFRSQPNDCVTSSPKPTPVVLLRVVERPLGLTWLSVQATCAVGSALAVSGGRAAVTGACRLLAPPAAGSHPSGHGVTCAGDGRPGVFLLAALKEEGALSSWLGGVLRPLPHAPFPLGPACCPPLLWWSHQHSPAAVPPAAPRTRF